MNPAFLLVLLALAYFIWSCIPTKDNTLVTSEQNGHTLKLIDHTSMRSIGDLNHQATLTFDGQLVSDYDPGFPVLPDLYPQTKTWLIHDNGPDLSNPDRVPWTVYVSPKTVNRADFDQLVACFNAKRAEFDAAIDNFGKPGYIQRGRIWKLIYGVAPQPLVFKPAQGRYKPVYPDDIRVVETFVIHPDGTWAFRLESENGKGGSLGGDIETDTMRVENGQLMMTKPFDLSQERMFKPKPDMANLSDAAYLRSFADSTGRPLLDVVRYPF